MAVMLIASVPGSTREQQQSMYDQLGERLARQDGFVFHAAGPTDGGWRLYEVWQDRERLERWLDSAVFPNLPEAAQPQMDVVPIEVVVRP